MERFWLGLILGVVAVTLMLPNCSASRDEIEVATELCDANGGVAHVRPSYYRLGKAFCENGAEFTLRRRETTND